MNSIDELIKSGRESKSLDFKKAVAWDESDKKSCCELVKDILAIANSGGGHVVIGVEDAASGFKIRGLSESELTTFDTSRLNRFLQRYADPPINTTLVKHSVDGATLVIIEIPSFHATPHLCKCDFPSVLKENTIYVRTDNNESAPVGKSVDLRSLLDLAVRHRQSELLEAMRAILISTGDSRIDQEFNNALAELRQNVQRKAIAETAYSDRFGGQKLHGRREAWATLIKPLEAPIPLKDLRSAAKAGMAEFRGWPFLAYLETTTDQPYAVDSGIECSIKHIDFAEQERADYWYFDERGLFFQTVIMWEDSAKGSSPEQKFMDFREFTMYVGEALWSICTMFEKLVPVDAELRIGFSVQNAMNRSLVNWRGMPFSAPYVSAIDQIQVVKAATLADWRAGLVEHAVEVCEKVFEKFNWHHPNLDKCRQIVTDLLAKRLVHG